MSIYLGENLVAGSGGEAANCLLLSWDIPKSSVYILTDEQNRITRCDGGYSTPPDLTGWIKIDEGTGDKYNLCQSHYFEGGMYTYDGIPLYKWDGQAVQPRTDDEIAADRAARPAPPPSPVEQLRADNALLRAQIAAATDRQEFLEDCIAEMAMQVYDV